MMKSQSMSTDKLTSLQFNEKLKLAEPGDAFVIYSPGISGWLRLKVSRVDWPYVVEERGGGLAPLPVHHSHVHKLEKATGEVWQR